jgi:lipopolysaccharide export system ATP-binding protein
VFASVRNCFLEIGRSCSVSKGNRRPTALWSGLPPLFESPRPSLATQKQEPAPGSALELRVEGLSKRYGRRTIIKCVDLHVISGRIVGLLGPNGAGKSTILLGILGAIPITAGRIILNIREITHEPMYLRVRAGIAYLPQEPSIFRNLTVAQNLLAILESMPLLPKERQSRLEEMMTRLDIRSLADTPAYALSGGERRRAEIARALVLSPKLLIMDEPFAGIDPIGVAEIQKIIVQLRENGIGALVSDHNVRETLRIADEAYIVVDGAILGHGSPAELAASNGVRRLYLGEDFLLGERQSATSIDVA